MKKMLLALVLTGMVAQAHEIGTTRVSALFHESRQFEIEIVADATALAEKLEASRGGTLPAGASASSLQSLLAASDEVFRRRVKIVFDGAEVHPAITFAVAPPIDSTSAAAATIRLTGDIPAGASHFTWTYSWTFASYAMQVHIGSAQANRATEWLEGGQTSKPFAIASPGPAGGKLETVWRYLTLGFTHIVPLGLDHMLFVLGIYLLSSRLGAVLWQVSAFTVAHSITLGLSMYGLVSVSPSIVEPLIAISIAYVAVENIFLSELKPWRVALVFAFGLLHGLGFAGALQELGLPRSEFVTALLAFNVGVEAGQLTVIGAAFLLVGWHCANRTWYRSRVVVPASVLIACAAIYWTIERLSS